jgi:hypothetical protein
MTSHAPSDIGHAHPRTDVATRLKASIGIAILTVSAAGVLHGGLGLPWTSEVQAAYAVIAGILTWRRMR